MGKKWTNSPERTCLRVDWGSCWKRLIEGVTMSQKDAPGDTQRGIVAELEISLVSVTRFVQDAEAVI